MVRHGVIYCHHGFWGNVRCGSFGMDAIVLAWMQLCWNTSLHIFPSRTGGVWQHKMHLELVLYAVHTC